MASTQGFSESLEDEEGVGRAVQLALRADDACSPCPGGQRHRYLLGADRPASFHGPQHLPGRQDVGASGRGLQLQGGQQCWQETPHPAVAGKQIVEVGVGCGAGGGVDGLNGGGELFARNGSSDDLPDLRQVAGWWIEQDLDRVT